MGLLKPATSFECAVVQLWTVKLNYTASIPALPLAWPKKGTSKHIGWLQPRGLVSSTARVHWKNHSHCYFFFIWHIWEKAEYLMRAIVVKKKHTVVLQALVAESEIQKINKLTPTIFKSISLLRTFQTDSKWWKWSSQGYDVCMAVMQSGEPKCIPTGFNKYRQRATIAQSALQSEQHSSYLSHCHGITSHLGLESSDLILEAFQFFCVHLNERGHFYAKITKMTMLIQTHCQTQSEETAQTHRPRRSRFTSSPPVGQSD